MELYLVFCTVAAATVLSPGPGVVMTLTNALRYGFAGTFGGILGIALGALIVAGVSATSLGILLATSALAFTIMKFIGAAYLVYLGVRLWRAPGYSFHGGEAHEAGFLRRFVEGLSLQLTNPKAIFFFLSIFPQFIDLKGRYIPQFSLLVLTYSALVVIIHCLYALFARQAKNWLTSARGGLVIRRGAALTFIGFGAALATARQ